MMRSLLACFTIAVFSMFHFADSQDSTLQLRRSRYRRYQFLHCDYNRSRYSRFNILDLSRSDCYFPGARRRIGRKLPSVRSGLESCKDIQSGALCRKFSDRGYCSSIKIWMSANCAKTCKVCSDKSSASSKSTGWTEWGSWSACSATCGLSYSFRKRTCGAAQASLCRGSAFENQKCNVESCQIWSEWASWSSCSSTCGLNSRQSRTRECFKSDIMCNGESKEEKHCVVPKCPKAYPSYRTATICEDVHASCKIFTKNQLCNDNIYQDWMIINCKASCGLCGFSDWESWSQCSVTCGSGIKTRTRLCNAIASECQGSIYEQEDCNMGACTAAKWSEWSVWSICSSTCGSGEMKRLRSCVNEPDCGTKLSGTSLEVKNCTIKKCPQMSNWSIWSSCDVTCGTGSQQRSRKCVNGPGCEGNIGEARKCNVESCPYETNCTDLRPDCIKFKRFCSGSLMDEYCAKTCGYCVVCNCITEWSSWSTCTRSCNTGSRFRTRKCSSAYLSCEKDVETCNDFICPETQWGVWSPCSKSCGGGTRTKTSYCSDDFSKCPTFYQDCETQPCPTKICRLGKKYRHNVDSECCKSSFVDSCGRNTNNGRIIGGLEAKDEQWPWMVYMTMTNILGDEAICGGTLISSEWVVTAGHCVSDFFKEDIRLTMGLKKIGDNKVNVQRRKIDEVIIHPQFNMPANDIALIKLDEPVRFTEFVRPICLPGGEKTSTDKHCFAAGWGKTNPASYLTSSTLNEVSLRILDMRICKAAYDATIYKRGIKEHAMLCAGKISGGVDTCAGDSGGPLMCQRCSSCSWYLAGVTSFGADNCGLSKHPGVYTNVVEYEPWIRSIVTSLSNRTYTGC